VASRWQQDATQEACLNAFVSHAYSLQTNNYEIQIASLRNTQLMTTTEHCTAQSGGSLVSSGGGGGGDNKRALYHPTTTFSIGSGLPAQVRLCRLLAHTRPKKARVMLNANGA
jgi:hypothetical protein